MTDFVNCGKCGKRIDQCVCRYKASYSSKRFRPVVTVDLPAEAVAVEHAWSLYEPGEPICVAPQKDARAELEQLRFNRVTCIACLDRAITYHRDMLDALVGLKVELEHP